MILDINTSKVSEFANTLTKMGKSALPVAIRGTLNKAAFDVKQNTMLKTSKQEFINRSPNFFKAFSKVQMAKGWDIGQMKSVIGFTEQGLKGGRNFAVKDLEEQERGGSIDGRSFIPTDKARGGNKAKPVRPGNRISGVKRLVKAWEAKGKNDGQKFAKSVAHAGQGGYVLAKFKGSQILWRVNSIRRTRKGQFKLTPLYSYTKNRSVRVKGTGFMKKASINTGSKIENFFIEEARRQFNKLK